MGGTERHAWDAQPLGRVVDRVIAEKLGCSIAAVCNARMRRGIPPKRTGHISARSKRTWALLHDAPFGLIPDHAIATVVGLHHTTVSKFRVQRAPIKTTAYGRRSVCYCGMPNTHGFNTYCSRTCAQYTQLGWVCAGLRGSRTDLSLRGPLWALGRLLTTLNRMRRTRRKRRKR